MDTLEMMRVFSAVAAEGSFTEGAKRLDMSVQTTSKYVKQLEQRLDAQLFERTTRSVKLSETGRAYYERCVDLIEQFDEVESSVREEHGQLEGKLRVTAPTSFGELHLTAALADFQREHPGIRFEINLTNQRLSLVDEGYDLGVRIGRLEDSSMIAKRLAPMRFPIVASPDYLERNGMPESPQALSEHTCIIDANLANKRSWPFRINGEIQRVPIDGPFETNAPQATRRAALAGVGIAVCPMYVISQDIVSGRLKVLFEEYEALEAGLYAVYPQRRHLSGRVRALVDFLAVRFRQIY